MESYIKSLEEAAEAAKIIFEAVSQTHKRPPVMCPHGNWPQYPTHAWWCDDCFNRLQFALDAAEIERNSLPTTHAQETAAPCEHMACEPVMLCMDCGEYFD